MSYQVLARKWRPRRFADLVGQAHVVRALVNALDADRLHHAFLFAGTRGVGKTTVARILAKCLNCETGVTSAPCGECAACRELDEGRFVDLIEVDAASRSKVDETRDLMENVQFAPTRGRYKVYLIDEVHMFSEKSFNALLKTLEEPPPHVKFLLATTDPQKLPITVLSRCLQFNLKRLPLEQIAAHLGHIVEREAVTADEAAIRLLARAADGSMRDALSLLDQAIAYGGGGLAEADVRAMLGTLDQGHVEALLGALAEGDAPALLARIDAMGSEAVEWAEALSELLGALQRLALVQAVPDALAAEPEEAERWRDLAARIAPEDVQLYYQIGLIGRRDLPLAPDPRGGFEMVMLRMLAFRPASSSGAAPPAPAPGAGAPTRPAAVATGARSAPPAAPAPPGDAAATGEGARAPFAIEASEWPDLIAALDLAGLTRELALHCTVAGCDAHTLRLRIAPEHRQLTAARVRDKLEAAVSHHAGREVRVRIEVGEHAEESPARRRARDDDARRAAALRAIEDDPGVQEICSTFDARVDGSLVRPVD